MSDPDGDISEHVVTAEGALTARVTADDAEAAIEAFWEGADDYESFEVEIGVHDLLVTIEIDRDGLTAEEDTPAEAPTEYAVDAPITVGTKLQAYDAEAAVEQFERGTRNSRYFDIELVGGMDVTVAIEGEVEAEPAG